MTENGSTLDNESKPETLADALAADVNSAQQANQADALSHLADELQLANDRALRAQAELENFRRRMRREVDDERKYASLPLLLDLLAVVDNLNRAIEAAEKSETATGLLQGVQMVQSQFLAIFDKHHCRRIGQIGAPFDPNQHQAIGQLSSNEVAANHIALIAQFGYQLHERVLRPAHVLVSTGPAPAPIDTASRSA